MINDKNLSLLVHIENNSGQAFFVRIYKFNDKH